MDFDVRDLVGERASHEPVIPNHEPTNHEAANPRTTNRTVISVAALLYFAAHVPFLAPSLEDIDSINFALGLRHFDPALHQPHPPGYPVYMLLGHISLP